MDKTQGAMYQVDLTNGSKITAIDLPAGVNPSAAIFDGKNNFYWVDDNSQQILRSNLTGKNTSIVYTLGNYIRVW